MGKNLVIVESPAKAKTITKFLGKDFEVKSSYGHVRDLAKKNLGIDIDNDFKPQYEISPDKKKVVSDLKKMASEADTVWLASDEDREGEAIAWHLAEVLKLKSAKTKRIVFHEITESAIKNAIENPRSIDIDLVNAQQARRVLDRIVGFKLSPLLWKKIQPALSAGRVQSVAVKLIVEREREIKNFKTVSEYRLIALFEINDAVVKAELNKRFKTLKEAEDFLNKSNGIDYKVKSIEKKPGKKSPAPPFTTSTLQQEASRKLGFSVSRTMQLAQNLYENGFITYMRTDSVNLSNLAMTGIKKVISEKFGSEYSKTRKYASKIKGAQEAHEAIRPTYINNINPDIGKQEQKLYDLIWKRAVASQMADAITEKTNIHINSAIDKYDFIASGEIIKFDGFLKLYIESTDDENGTEETQGILPNLNKGDLLNMQQIEAIEKFTQQPYRYSEASLVKKLEELGIGRPSTYAPTISTIQNRGYVVRESKPGNKRDFNYIVLSGKTGQIKHELKKENFGKEQNKLFPTSIGVVVTDYLDAHFKDILNYNFTAKIEEEFDLISVGKIKWETMIDKFYKTFSVKIEESLKEVQTTNKWEREVGKHPDSGNPIILKVGKYGPYASVLDDPPRSAALRKNQNIETIGMEEILDLFKLPRKLGEYQNDEVVVAIGKYGPYVRNNKKFTALKKTDDPYTISLERAIELIDEKESKTSNKFQREFDEIPGLQVLKGRYGPYISFEKKNYRIPKGHDPETITAEECKKIIEKSKK
jgi:DNA topoisomerase I